MTAMEAIVVGSSTRPAWSGPSPRTSCKYCEKKKSSPLNAKIAVPTAES